MSSAIFRNGHWRRRDPLEGLSPTMLNGLVALDRGGEALKTTAVRTVLALADRGLIRRSAGPDGLDPGFRLTREGLAVLAELDRRAAARAALIEEKPARALTEAAP